MTEEQNKLLETIFKESSRCHDGYYGNQIYIYAVDPKTITDLKHLKDRDRLAQTQIAELEDLLATFKALRLAYAERCAQLCAMPSYPVISLKRESRGRIYYYLSTFRRYENGQETRHDTKRFNGSDRAAAIQEYKAYVKNHPGIIAEMDIQKGAREK